MCISFGDDAREKGDMLFAVLRSCYGEHMNEMPTMHHERIATISAGVAFILYLVLGVLGWGRGILPYLVCYGICYVVIAIVSSHRERHGKNKRE